MKKINLALIAVLLISVIIVTVSAQEQYNCPMGGMMYGLYGNYGSGFMILSWLTFILFIALIIAAIYWLIKSANKKK